MDCSALFRRGALAGLLLLAARPGLAEFDLDPERVGAWPGYIRGPAYAVAISGRYACVAAESFQVLDVADASSPRLLGGCATGGMAFSVAVAGAHAYVADQRSGLQVIDIQDPTRPRIVGTYRRLPEESESAVTYWTVAVSGHFACLVESYWDDRKKQSLGQLHVIDVREPASPVRVSGLELPGRPFALAISGGYAYVGAYAGGFHTIDLSDPLAPRLMSSQAGSVSSVAVAGHYAYLVSHEGGSAPVLRVLDVSDPALPRRVGRLGLHGWAHGLTVSGSHVYLAASDAGLQVIDVTDPAVPRSVGRGDAGKQDRQGYGVTVLGNLAYVAAESQGLQVFDVSQPATPTLKSECRLLGTAQDIALSEGRVYVADGYSGLQVLDATSPARLRWLGNFVPAGDVVRVAVSGSLAYVIERSTNPTNSNDTLHVIETQDALNLQPIAGVQVRGTAADLAIAGHYAYVCGDYLQVIDIAEPRNPKRTGDYQPTAFCGTVAVSGAYAYLGEPQGGVAVIDVSNPARPRPVGGYTGRGGAPTSIALWSHYAIVGEGPVWTELPYGLLILDVKDPTRPERVASYDAPISTGKLIAADGRAYAADIVDLSIPNRPHRIGYTRPGKGMALSGPHLYVAAGEAGIEVLDVSRRARVPRVAQFATPRDALRVGVSGGYAYVSEQQWDSERGPRNRLEILDISNPAAPRLVGGGESDSFYNRLIVPGSFAYAAAGLAGLHVLDASKPADLQTVGAYDTEGEAMDVEVLGGYAYLADHFNGLLVLDISNPTAPRLAGHAKTKGVAAGVAVSGRYAFIADAYAGLSVVEISEPSAPRWIAGLELAGDVSTLAISGHYACLAAQRAGLQIVDVSDPAHPRWIAACDTGNETSGVAVSGQYVYVTDRRAGISVIDLSDPRRPRRMGGNTSFNAFGLALGSDRVYVAAGSRGVLVLDGLRLGPSLDVNKLNANELELRLRAVPGESIRLQTSSDLRVWEDWRVVDVTEAEQRLVDDSPGRLPMRFYR